MKVIGHGSSETHIVAISATELEQLTGVRGRRYVSQPVRFDIGTELKIDETWHKLRDLECRKDAVEQASASLVGLAQTLDMLLQPIVKHALDPEPEGGEA